MLINKIKKRIEDIIMDNGYLAVDDFMSMVVPFYYSNCNALGQRGDFITAPEISQLFGEMLGLYCADWWLNKKFDRINIVEFGPGNGYLIIDFLRATRHIKGFHDAIDKIILYESSDLLKSKQEEVLNQYISKCIWIDGIDDLNKAVGHDSCIFIANEFFDALPIKQFSNINGDWHEICLVLDDNNRLSLKPFRPVVLDRVKSSIHPSFIEHSSIADTYLKIINDSVKDNGGIALIIDYGYSCSPGCSTLQAVKEHKRVGIFDHIGYSDLTYLVNFSWLNNYSLDLGNKTRSFIQSDFLEFCGIKKRAEQLINKSGCDKAMLEKQLKILTSPEEMGELFKVLVIKNEL